MRPITVLIWIAVILALLASTVAAQTPTPTASPTMIPTVAINFSSMQQDAEPIITAVFAAGEADNPIQYLALAFGGMLLSFAVLSFITALIWPD
jgi:hypothetical protein